jgi:endoglycosylceramidase
MRRILVALLLAATVVASLPAQARSAPTAGPLLALRATRGAVRAIFDSEGRQVLLRGVNYNKLGDYYQANPAFAPVVPQSPDDFPLMARLGFNSVRLLVSWSRLEPAPGTIDQTYLDEIRAAVAAAKANGLYSIIDMHQDAWGKYIASPPGTICPPGKEPAIGWDGAPEWATIFDPGPNHENTCRQGARESSEAVLTAWDNFYADTAGIQSHLVDVWGVLGATFASEPTIAGYDLLNEPNEGHTPASAVGALGRFYRRAIDAIRASEVAAGGFPHIVFFETTVFGTPVPFDFSSDPNIVFSGHNYAESIAPPPLTVEGVFGYFNYLAEQYGTALWIGEYGWFSDPAANKEKLQRYGMTEDSLAGVSVAGSAWWQFSQACGDPHSIGTPGGTPPAEMVHLRRTECPSGNQSEPVPQWTAVLSRPYPRATPGRITSLTSDGDAITMTLTGETATSGGTFVIWVPAGRGRPSISGHHIQSAEVSAVDGGFLVTGSVCGSYTVTINSSAAALETPMCTAPALVTPAFTG